MKNFDEALADLMKMVRPEGYCIRYSFDEKLVDISNANAYVLPIMLRQENNTYLGSDDLHQLAKSVKGISKLGVFKSGMVVEFDGWNFVDPHPKTGEWFWNRPEDPKQFPNGFKVKWNSATGKFENEHGHFAFNMNGGWRKI